MARNLIKSDMVIRAIKLGAANKRLSDGDGLYLLTFVKGKSHGWRFDYSFEGRRKTLSLGTYPATGLALARQKADDARRLIAEGIDPSAVRKAQKSDHTQRRKLDELNAAGLPAPESFEQVAREWYDRFKDD